VDHRKPIDHQVASWLRACCFEESFFPQSTDGPWIRLLASMPPGSHGSDAQATNGLPTGSTRDRCAPCQKQLALDTGSLQMSIARKRRPDVSSALLALLAAILPHLAYRVGISCGSDFGTRLTVRGLRWVILVSSRLRQHFLIAETGAS